MLEPMVLPDCGHTFCKSCLTKIKKKKEARHCPLCVSPIHAHTKLLPNYSVKQLVGKIRAKCKDCNVEDLLEKLAEHDCPEALIACSNRECRQNVKKKDARTHEKSECLYRVVSCDKCYQSTTVANEELHLKTACPEGKINCPLNCQERPKRLVF